MKKRSVSVWGGGGGRALPAKLGIEDIACPLSSRTSFGICPSTPVARNVGQTLNQSCSPREKRHREKRGFRLVPLLARAVQGDKNMQCDRKNELSSRGANEVSDVVSLATECHLRLVGHDILTPNQLGSRLDRRWIATLPVVARNDVGRLARLAFTMAEILLSLTIIGLVAPLPLTSSAGTSTQTDAGKLCQKLDSESRLPTREELASMFYNKLLIDMPEDSDANAWSSSVIYESGALKAVNQGFISGIQLYYDRSREFGIRCVKR